MINVKFHIRTYDICIYLCSYSFINKNFIPCEYIINFLTHLFNKIMHLLNNLIPRVYAYI